MSALTLLQVTASDWLSSFASTMISNVQDHPKRWAVGALTATALAMLAHTDPGARMLSGIVPTSLHPVSWRQRRIAKMGQQHFENLTETWERLPPATIDPTTMNPIYNQSQVEFLESVATAALTRWTGMELSRERAEQRLAEITATDMFFHASTNQGIAKWVGMWSRQASRGEKGRCAGSVDSARWSVSEARLSDIGRQVQDLIEDAQSTREEQLYTQEWDPFGREGRAPVADDSYWNGWGAWGGRRDYY